MEHIPTLAELRERHGDGEDLAAAVDRALAGHVAAMEAIDAAADGGELTASQQRRWDVHSRAVDELRAWSKEQRAENLRQSRARFGALTVGAERPEPTAKLSDAQQRALRMVDEQRNLDSKAGDRLHELIRSENPDCDGEVIAARTVLTMDRNYRSAFMQLTTQQHPMLTDEEVRAVRAVKDWERRTMQIGDPNAGGLAVPVVIDPTIVLTAQGSGNPFTGLARIETITTDTWRGLTSTGVTWRWADELSEATDNSPTILRPEIPTVRADGFIPFSIEVGQDWANFQSEMTRLLASGYNELVVEALTTGTTGAGEPTGVVSRLEASTAVGVQLATTTAGEIGGVDLRALWAGLPPRVRNSDRTAFMSSVSVREHVRRLAADPAGVGEGDPSFALTGGLMFERPYRVNEFMDTMPSGTSAGTLLLVGDFTGFVIAQRAGMSVEFIPHLFGSNNRPVGARGLFAWARIGSDVIDEGRFRILVNKT